MDWKERMKLRAAEMDKRYEAALDSPGPEWPNGTIVHALSSKSGDPYYECTRGYLACIEEEQEQAYNDPVYEGWENEFVIHRTKSGLAFNDNYNHWNCPKCKALKKAEWEKIKDGSRS